MSGISNQVMQGLKGVAQDVPKGVGEVGIKTVEDVLETGAEKLSGDMFAKKQEDQEMDPELALLKKREAESQQVARDRIAQLNAELQEIVVRNQQQSQKEVLMEDRQREEKQKIEESKKKSFWSNLFRRKTKGTGEKTKQLG